MQFLITRRFLALLMLMIAAPCYSAQSQSLPVALVYFGPGVCSGCPQSLAKVIKKSGYEVRRVNAGGISKESLKDVKIFAIPGGDDVRELMDALQSGESAAIREFVAKGGNYLGVCLGAYVASRSELGLFNGEIRAHSKTIEARMENVSWLGKPRWVYFQDGPEFKTDDADKSDVWSVYRTGETAALIQSYKLGHIGLVGPHLESDQSWLDDDNLSDMDGDDSNLLVEFIKAISK